MKLFLLIILSIVATGCGVKFRFEYSPPVGFAIETSADVAYLQWKQAASQPATQGSSR